MIFKLHSFEVGHASFAASVDDLVGKVAFVGVVLDLELVFEFSDCSQSVQNQECWRIGLAYGRKDNNSFS
jgi:hypothetical protein